jgi:hypothetical protein
LGGKLPYRLSALLVRYKIALIWQFFEGEWALSLNIIAELPKGNMDKNMLKPRGIKIVGKINHFNTNTIFFSI